MQRVNIIRFQAYRNLISFFVRPAWVRRKWETGAGAAVSGIWIVR